MHELKGIVEWVASNSDAFERAISNSHLETALLDGFSRLLLEYLNDCVQVSCTGNLTQPDYLTLVSFLHLRIDLKFLPYHGIARLHPTLQALVRDRYIRHVAAGLPTPGSSESHLIGMVVAAEMKRDGGRGSNGGGGRGKSGGNSNARPDLPARPVNASGVARQIREGTHLTNPARISVLTLRSGDNTHDILRNMALPTLGGSVW